MKNIENTTENNDELKKDMKSKLNLNLGDGSSGSSKGSESTFNPLISPRGFVPVSRSLENQSRLDSSMKITPRDFSLKSLDILNRAKNSPSNRSGSVLANTEASIFSPRKESKISSQKSEQELYQDLNFL